MMKAAFIAAFVIKVNVVVLVELHNARPLKWAYPCLLNRFCQLESG